MLLPPLDAPMHLDELQRLPRELFSALALLAAERLLPVLQSYSRENGTGEASIVRTALVTAWSDLTRGSSSGETLEDLSREIYAIRPETEGNESPLSSYALDATGAAWEAIEAIRTNDASHAAAAAQIAYESVLLQVEDREELDPQDIADRAATETRLDVVAEVTAQATQLAHAKALTEAPVQGAAVLRATYSQLLTFDTG